MTVNRYLFQSPYTSQVQVGRPDPSVKQEQGTQTQSTGAELLQTTNQTVQEAKSFEVAQVSEVKPTVDSAQLLDVYA